MLSISRRFMSSTPPPLPSILPGASIMKPSLMIKYLSTPLRNESARHVLISLDVSKSKVGFAHSLPFTSLLNPSEKDGVELPIIFPHSTVSRRERNASKKKWIYNDNQVFGTLAGLPKLIEPSHSYGDGIILVPSYIVGYPLDLNGGDSNPQCLQVEDFVLQGEERGVFLQENAPSSTLDIGGRVCLWDERFSTREAYSLAVDIMAGGDNFQSEYDAEFGDEEDEGEDECEDNEDEDWSDSSNSGRRTRKSRAPKKKQQQERQNMRFKSIKGGKGSAVGGFKAAEKFKMSGDEDAVAAGFILQGFLDSASLN